MIYQKLCEKNVSSNEIIKVYVGGDRSQQIAIPVLEHSIRRNTAAEVELIPMVDLPVPQPKDPRNWQRTGFSFSRFCIPKLAGYKGKAIYLDADMLVLNDIQELWNIPFDGAKVIIQKEVKFEEESKRKVGSPRMRKIQSAVMVLDCERLDWDIHTIIDGLDAEYYNYDQLLHHLCILDEKDIKYGVPFEWNSLEHWDRGTRLIHYTDVSTQPWVACGNKLGSFWFNEVRQMISQGVINPKLLQQEIDLGYLRPSLLRDINFRHYISSFLLKYWDRLNSIRDRAKGYVKHKALYEMQKLRVKEIEKHEKKYELS